MWGGCSVLTELHGLAPGGHHARKLSQKLASWHRGEQLPGLLMECSGRARGRAFPPCRPYRSGTPFGSQRPPAKVAPRSRWQQGEHRMQWGEKLRIGPKFRQNRCSPPDRNTRQISDRRSCSEGTQKHHAM
jgi:hypothetical protein